MANVNFTGIDEDLTAPNTPWIYYGGSYAGARAAHMRILYPDLVYGAIASSGTNLPPYNHHLLTVPRCNTRDDSILGILRPYPAGS